MAKDADHSNLGAILYSALTDSTKCNVLLEHPKFRNRAMLICRQIAAPNQVEDLFHDTWLRVLSYADSFDPDPLETEEKFFAWFTSVARNVHFDEKRTIVDWKTCTDSSRHWPDLSRDVSETEMDEFLNHIDSCVYHTDILALEEQEDEKEMRSIFRLARGLDPHGGILTGAPLEGAIKEHERRMKSWNEWTAAVRVSFSHIALYNGNRQIASCGKFLDFSKHESVNELDEHAGIQIRGIKSADASEDVLLGFYPLRAVRHEGDEQLLPLDNGYTVGLTINRLTETIFQVRFRCVESKVIENERLNVRNEAGNKRALGMSAGAGGSTSTTRYSANPLKCRPADLLPPLIGRSNRSVPSGWHLPSKLRNKLITGNEYLLRLFITPSTVKNVTARLAFVIMLGMLVFVANRIYQPIWPALPHASMDESMTLDLLERSQPTPGDLSNNRASQPISLLTITDASLNARAKETVRQNSLNPALNINKGNSNLSGKVNVSRRNLHSNQHEFGKVSAFHLDGDIDKAVNSELDLAFASCPSATATRLAATVPQNGSANSRASADRSLSEPLRVEREQRLNRRPDSQ